MLMEGTKQPFVMVIPSFRGFLSTRFIPDEACGETIQYLIQDLKDIQSIKIEFPMTPDSSFFINRTGKFKYTLTELKGNKPMPYDTMKLLNYLSSFEEIRYESLLNHILR